MLQVRDKLIGTMYCEEGINTVADAALHLKDFMNEDDTLIVNEVKSGHEWYLLYIVDSTGDQIDIYGFLHP